MLHHNAPTLVRQAPKFFPVFFSESFAWPGALAVAQEGLHANRPSPWALSEHQAPRTQPVMRREREVGLCYALPFEKASSLPGACTNRLDLGMTTLPSKFAPAPWRACFLLQYGWGWGESTFKHPGACPAPTEIKKRNVPRAVLQPEGQLPAALGPQLRTPSI